MDPGNQRASYDTESHTTRQFSQQECRSTHCIGCCGTHRRENSGWCATRYAARVIYADVQTRQWTPCGSIQMVADRSIRGHVVDEQGRPLAGVKILVTSAAVDAQAKKLQRLGPAPWEPYSFEPERTSSSGAFLIEGVPAQAVRIWAGRVDCLFVASEVIAAGDGTPEVELRLLPLPDEFVIEGQVFGKDGAPLPFAFLYASADRSEETQLMLQAMNLPDSQSWRVRIPRIETDAEGRFRFLPRELVPHSLLAEDPDDRWEDVLVEKIQPASWGVELRF